MTFAHLYVSQEFRFAAEHDAGYQGARGPWMKVGPRSYRAIEKGYASGPTHTVGTVKVAVISHA